MRPTATLSLYIGRQFAVAVLAAVGALTLLVGLFDFLEILRRAASRPHTGFLLVMGIEALRLPWLMMQILPFGVLLGGIYAFWRMSRASELIVARAAGVSAWQFLALPVLFGAALGAFATAAISPLSARLMARANLLESIYIEVGAGPLALSNGELWLRQGDSGLVPGGVAILHAHRVALRQHRLTADQVSVFRLGPHDRFLARIEAPRARLARDAWVLEDARTLVAGHLPGPPQSVRLPTDLTVSRVEESFAAPDTLSFWSLPGFIRLLQRSGFSAIAHRLRFQALLALPLLCATMALVAAGFSVRSGRRSGVGKILASGVAAGFAIFMVSEIADQFGQSGAVPVALAAWAPAASGLMMALALLLHLEDG